MSRQILAVGVFYGILYLRLAPAGGTDVFNVAPYLFGPHEQCVFLFITVRIEYLDPSKR